MPTKYCDRLNLPVSGVEDVSFSTKIGLKIAVGYKKVLLSGKPMIEFTDTMIQKENIFLPESQRWKVKNSAFPFVEYRSKDFCKVKILKNKKSGRFYISPFDLTSDKYPVLISPLLRKKTILQTATLT